MEREYLTVQEAAELLRVAPGTVRRWVGSGKLPHLRIGQVLRIPKVGIETMIRREENRAKPPVATPTDTREETKAVLARLDAVIALDEITMTSSDSPRVRQRAREIAMQATQRRVYDNVYAALAEIEKCEFWTADLRYFNAVKGFLPHVRYIGDYTLPEPES